MAKKPTGLRELTAKQALFVQEYMVDLSATHAAIRAGYSPKSAGTYAHEMLGLPHVQDAVAKAFAARSERVKIDADWVLRRLVDEADADLADILDDAGAVRPVKDWPKIWRKGLVTGIDVEEIRNRDGELEGHVRKLKLSERIKRIELIARHIDVGALKDKVETSGAITLNINQEDAEL